MTSRALSINPYTVVDDGSVAVEKLVNEGAEFDLAFFDINMPIMGGVEALRQAGGVLRTSTRPMLNLLILLLMSSCPPVLLSSCPPVLLSSSCPPPPPPPPPCV